MNSKKHQKSYYVDEENPYWISFSDLMSGLLVIFILASLALIIELTQTKIEVNEAIEEVRKAEQIRKNILQEMQEELEKEGIRVEVSDNDAILRIPDDQLTFNSNQYDIPEDEKIRRATIRIGEVLYQAITREKRWKYLDTIFLEGHTDSRPSNRTKGNWGLSTFRAISVWEYWLENLNLPVTFNEMTNYEGNSLFSVSGYAASRRINILEETNQERRQNRRIDLRFTVKRPSILELEKIDKRL